MSMLYSLGVQPLTRSSRHGQTTVLTSPRPGASLFFRHAVVETAALSLTMTITSLKDLCNPIDGFPTGRFFYLETLFCLSALLFDREKDLSRFFKLLAEPTPVPLPEEFLRLPEMAEGLDRRLPGAQLRARR